MMYNLHQFSNCGCCGGLICVYEVICNCLQCACLCIVLPHFPLSPDQKCVISLPFLDWLEAEVMLLPSSLLIPL